MGKEGITAALDAGADTIEHGDGLDEELMDRMIAKGVYWCPTIYVGVWVADGRGKLWQEMRDLEAKAFGLAVKKGSRSPTAPTPAATPGPRTRPRSSPTWSSTA